MERLNLEDRHRQSQTSHPTYSIEHFVTTSHACASQSQSFIVHLRITIGYPRLQQMRAHFEVWYWRSFNRFGVIMHWRSWSMQYLNQVYFTLFWGSLLFNYPNPCLNVQQERFLFSLLNFRKCDCNYDELTRRRWWVWEAWETCDELKSKLVCEPGRKTNAYISDFEEITTA